MSHHIVFYAPLWGEDEGGVHAAANEQQAIGRVLRIGQRRDVNVHRILAKGPKGQETIEERVVEPQHVRVGDEAGGDQLTRSAGLTAR